MTLRARCEVDIEVTKYKVLEGYGRGQILVLQKEKAHGFCDTISGNQVWIRVVFFMNTDSYASPVGMRNWEDLL
jgi:hypothetical protein